MKNMSTVRKSKMEPTARETSGPQRRSTGLRTRLTQASMTLPIIARKRRARGIPNIA